ncbi:MAG: hypothetical protein ABH858_07275 [Candidatus Omnitrophota bacterium]
MAKRISSIFFCLLVIIDLFFLPSLIFSLSCPAESENEIRVRDGEDNFIQRHCLFTEAEGLKGLLLFSGLYSCRHFIISSDYDHCCALWQLTSEQFNHSPPFVIV